MVSLRIALTFSHDITQGKMALKILLTGAAGFIGFTRPGRCSARRQGIGIDNLNNYYDVALKEARLASSRRCRAFASKVDLGDAGRRSTLAADKPDRVVHLAAQAEVRYATRIHMPTWTQLDGFVNVLEGCRHNGVRHLVYASSSSVYGANTAMPFRPPVRRPSGRLYAATKKANELMAHSYAHLYRCRDGAALLHGLRPLGAARMAMFVFA